MAIEQLNEHGHIPTDGANRWATGTYATGNKTRGIRNHSGAWPATGAFPTPSTTLEIDPLNFSDIGYDVTGPQVHADGEIWTATNFDVRKALAAKYDAQYPESDQALQDQCARGQVAVDRCPGNRRWIQLMFDSFLLMPTNPSMVDARNAQLAADTMRFGGANQAELWLAFARRGLGRNASTTNGMGRAAGVESDTNPLPDFEAPERPNASITFAATTRDAAQSPVNARVYVGHYEARVSPIADTDPATDAPATASSNNLDETATFAPGTYEFIATAPGYGAVRFRRAFAAGATQTVSIRMAANLASKAQGATASGDAAPRDVGDHRGALRPAAARPADRRHRGDPLAGRGAPERAVLDGQQPPGDDRPRRHGAAADQPGAGQRAARPRLGPERPRRPDAEPVHGVAQLRGLDVQHALRRLLDGRGLQSRDASAGDAFPSDAPRPVAPSLILREFTFSRTSRRRMCSSWRAATQCTRRPGVPGRAGR